MIRTTCLRAPAVGSVIWMVCAAFMLHPGLLQAQTFNWQTAAPESSGFQKEALQQLQDSLAARGTKGLLIVRNDRVVWEWYARDHGPDERHYSASLAKALVGGLSLGVAVEDGGIALDDTAAAYIPAWRTDPIRSLITIRQLATHSSGIEDAAVPEAENQNELPGWKGAFWRGRGEETFEGTLDPFSIAVYQAPIVYEPGTDFAYSNPGMAALSYAVTAAIQNGPQTDLRSMLAERIMQPIGIAESHWSIGYGATPVVDGLPLVANWGGGSFTARAAARIGRLMLRKGHWEGRQLLSPATVEEIVSYGGTPLPPRPQNNPFPAPAAGWYTNTDGVWPELPRDAFAGAGAQQQLLLVIPSLDLIVVRNGSDLRRSLDETGFWGAAEAYLFNPLMEAVTDLPADSDGRGSPPYPPSSVVDHVNWAPPASIVRRAAGSDNWPMTWAEDNSMYTAYGDGWGFAPMVDNKLSLGLARVTGTPDDLMGVNIRSSTGEQLGDGPAGKKASGMLMVDSTLYMWARNANNSQLAWSTDHGKTWTWSDWRFTTSFGYPGFLNFGRNYEGARDDYVYIYSPDSDSAYVPADRMVLARVHRDSIRDRSAYQFFVRRSASSEPVWSRDLRERGAVFEHASRCYRHGITYNAGLGRYFWVQVLPESPHERGPRFAGGLGIYDAPSPWGPWTTVYYTPLWDVGPGETASLPTKWMSANGRTMHLVFSGDDHFSVRRLELMLRDN